MSKCCAGGANHSNDLVSVYFGGVAPVLLCGFHASFDLSKLLAEKAAANV